MDWLLTGHDVVDSLKALNCRVIRLLLFWNLLLDE